MESEVDTVGKFLEWLYTGDYQCPHPVPIDSAEKISDDLAVIGAYPATPSEEGNEGEEEQEEAASSEEVPSSPQQDDEYPSHSQPQSAHGFLPPVQEISKPAHEP